MFSVTLLWLPGSQRALLTLEVNVLLLWVQTSADTWGVEPVKTEKQEKQRYIHMTTSAYRYL